LETLENLTLHIEALIFASEQALTVPEINLVLQAVQAGVSDAQIEDAIRNIREKYDAPDFAISLVSISGGYQFLTKKQYYGLVNQLQLQRSRKKLSQAALETLAIIAYRQPITKLEVEQIRGVNCDYTIQRLLEKELISIAGKSESIGKPLLYSTSSLFMDYFGINHIAELPQLKDLTSESSEIGETSE
jgi:segregation and condensation protein B